MSATVLGCAETHAPRLPTLDTASTFGLDVPRWAARPARLARMDRLCAMALVACDAALLDAGLSPEDPSWAPTRTGIVLGTAFGCHATNEAYYGGYFERGIEGASPRLFAYTLPSSPVGEITIHHQIQGPASTQVGGLVAAIDALREALRHLERGRADRMLVAAVDVASPMLDRLGQSMTHDSASAIVLQRGERGIARAASRYVAGDPIAATRAVVAVLEVRPDKIHAPVRLHPLLGELFPQASIVSLRDELLSAAPLAALRGRETAMILTADPSGQAGGFFVEA